MKPRLSIVHYQPVESYPPVMNLLNIFIPYFNIHLYTNEALKYARSFSPEDIDIQRYPNIVNGANITKRLLTYLKFTINVWSRLRKDKPEILIYYETNSALPVFLYCILSLKKPLLYIHYHEYNSKEQYKSGMKIVFISYLIEKYYLWKKASWISHTNDYRCEMFRNDYPGLNPAKIQILPNYPPKLWQDKTLKPGFVSTPLKMVYVGSLSLENFYLQEFCNWVISQQGNVLLDIFTHNVTATVRNYLNSLNSIFINTDYQGIWYYDLPELLRNYQVGVILYKAFNENFTYNETNKLFEYHVCGLDVWFANETKGIHRHITKNTYPKIVPIDYNHLEHFNWQEKINREQLSFKIMDVSCNDVYTKFLRTIQLKNKVLSFPEKESSNFDTFQ